MAVAWHKKDVTATCGMFLAGEQAHGQHLAIISLSFTVSEPPLPAGLCLVRSCAHPHQAGVSGCPWFQIVVLGRARYHPRSTLARARTVFFVSRPGARSGRLGRWRKAMRCLGEPRLRRVECMVINDSACHVRPDRIPPNLPTTTDILSYRWHPIRHVLN